MQTQTQIRELLAQAGLSPRKRFGQNFLVDQNHIRRLLDAACVATGDTVLEVGPGTGTLTEELLARGARVIASEIDRGLCGVLRSRLGGEPGFTLVEGDCLDSKSELSASVAAAIGGEPFKLVANLPYACATPLMLTLLVRWPRCSGLWVTIQKEVAERIEARPGDEAYGAISIVSQVAARVARIGTLSPGCFWPSPKVTSAMIAIERAEAAEVADLAGFAAFVQRAFANRRKQLGSAIGREGKWPPGVRPDQRAEELNESQFVELWRIRA